MTRPDPHQIRILTTDDAPAYRTVRLAALQNDPLAFVTTAEEFAARSLPSVAEQLAPRETSVTFGAFVGGELLGILTLARETRPTIRHRGNIFGVAVLPQARGQGCGDALIHSALAHAQTWSGLTSLHLAVIETQGTARRLYERHGFCVWGTQPDAVQHRQRSYAEHWMWRQIGGQQKAAN